MGRNIILCADGTGNKGGFTPDSNVFKVYEAVDIKPSQTNEPAQITFYDNGVGTSDNRFWKALSGAFGFGFQRKICELYTFLSKNYQPGDKVFLFGFSRGAAAIRALNGLIHDCGLIDASAYENEFELKKEVSKLIKIYLRHRWRGNDTLKEVVPGCHSPRRDIDITFIGVWDTVSALGMPKKGDVTEFISLAINKVLNGIDIVVNLFICHREYNFQLGSNIKRARHAMSIDDARTSFWPRIWNEVKAELKDVDVKQVWYAGMHSDVGGGYERQDMSAVSLLWILENAQECGLRLNQQNIRTLSNRANVHDKIHDSRGGTGLFYRLHPRDLETLCINENPKQGPELLRALRIDKSVLSRMHHRTAGYAPALLPPKFEVFNGESPSAPVQTVDATQSPVWEDLRKRQQLNVKALKELYVYQMVYVLMLVSSCIHAWNRNLCPDNSYLICPDKRSGLMGTLADTLDYFTPAMFENAIELWVYQQPLFLAGLIALIAFWWCTRTTLRAGVRANAIAQRQIILASAEGKDLGQLEVKITDKGKYALGLVLLIPFGLLFYAINIWVIAQIISICK